MNEVDRQRHLSLDEFAHRKAVQFSSFLKALVEANEYSTDLTISPWKFALGCEQAMSMGISLNDLRWMMARRWIQCHEGEDNLPDPRALPYAIQRDSTFIISHDGLNAYQSSRGADALKEPKQSVRVEHAVSSRNHFSERTIPLWNVDRRELSISGRVVKRFRWPAPNQETIICVFSEEGWPARIEDPLPQGNGLDPKRRLSDTIKCLNRNQNANLIKFRGDGTGEGILWDMTPNQSQ